MSITETSADGLKREFKVVITAQDIEQKVTAKLGELRQTVQLPGFRPGKVPAGVVKQRYGGGVLAEVLEESIASSSRDVLSERNLRPALQPKIEVEKYEDGGDLTFNMAVELLPEIEPGDFSGIELEKPVVEVDDKSVDESLERLAAANSTQAPITEDRAAANGDIALIDFAGTVDGEALPGMDGTDHPLELGSGQFIPGFEEQLVGAKAGEHHSVKVTFPADYPHERLKGAEAIFEVDVKELRQNVPAEVNDALAKEFGMEDLAALRTAIRERIAGEYGNVSRLRVKRALLDNLAESYSFAVPQGMVDIEFDGIWQRLQQELKNGSAGEDADKSEDDLKTEYRAIAERRVRLGLLLSEVGRRNDVQVTQEELNRALVNEARRFPGQERQVFEFFQQNKQALESLRAPIFEDKVVDLIISQAKVTEKTVSVEELTKDEDETAEA